MNSFWKQAEGVLPFLQIYVSSSLNTDVFSEFKKKLSKYYQDPILFKLIAVVLIKSLLS